MQIFSIQEISHLVFSRVFYFFSVFASGLFILQVFPFLVVFLGFAMISCSINFMYYIWIIEYYRHEALPRDNYFLCPVGVSINLRPY